MKRTLFAIGVALASIPAPATADDPLGGFVANATATPIKIELYEPTVPMPGTPQGELDISYTVAKGVTGPAGRGRSSWLWPGDAVGEGLKVIGDTVGLPGALTEGGYRIQVNSQTPGEPSQQAQEPVPGVAMKASSDDHHTIATSTLGSTSDPSADSGGTEASSSGGGLLDSLQSGDLSALGAAITGPSAAPEPTGDPAPIPGGLSALVDAQGVRSVSRSDYGGSTVRSQATSKISGLSLLGGIITADAVTISTRTTSNLDKVTTKSATRYVGLAFAGHNLVVGPEGVTAEGADHPIPGLPADPVAALQELGITFALPVTERTVDASRAQLHTQGLQVVIDTRVLRSQLDTSAISGVVGQLPDDAAQLKSVLGAALQVAPQIVITLGTATSLTDAVPRISIPPTSGGAPGGTNGDTPGTSSGGSPLPSFGTTTPTNVPSAPMNVNPAAPATSVPLANAAAGLPPLGSIPSLLLFGSLALAALFGRLLKRMGAVVLGGGQACHHGLATGVPDLRKV